MRDIVAAGALAHRLAVAVAPADRFALLVFGQFRFVAELDAARLRWSQDGAAGRRRIRHSRGRDGTARFDPEPFWATPVYRQVGVRSGHSRRIFSSPHRVGSAINANALPPAASRAGFLSAFFPLQE